MAGSPYFDGSLWITEKMRAGFKVISVLCPVAIIVSTFVATITIANESEMEATKLGIWMGVMFLWLYELAGSWLNPTPNLTMTLQTDPVSEIRFCPHQLPFAVG